MMNKFEGPDDPQFKLVRHQIRILVSGAHEVLKRRRNGRYAVTNLCDAG